MKSHYKMLGDYIREVNVRNTELKDLDLLGISIQKEFIPSIANTIGTDMSKYKIVKKNQFAYGTVTSRNGDKISIALLQNCNEALISQAYISFEVIDENILLPEYLMMWFRREEFDRYARYMSFGSAREVFSWEEMLNVKLPVPTIEKQREIVKEYNTILNRIKLNNNMIERLEDLVQSVFKKLFDDNDDEYEEIKFENFAVPKKGKSITRAKTIHGPYPVVAGGIMPSCYHNSFNTKKPVITISASGANAGYVNLYHTEVWSSDSSFIDSTITKYIYFCYVFLKLNQEKITSMQEGTGQPHIYPEHIMNLNLKKYPVELVENFEKIASTIFKKINFCLRENVSLKNMSELCMLKIASMGESI